MFFHRLFASSVVVASFAASLFVPADALAQAEAELEEITVTATTGTSIRGVAPTGSALIEVDREAIDNSAGALTIDILRETPQVTTFGVNDTSRNGSGGSGNITYSNAVNLRALGPVATLTLVNGRRPVSQGTQTAWFDPSSIPSIALQRVEIIADGASAIYGSDAIAGVANLITLRGYDGIGVDMQYGVGDGYDQHHIGLIAGKSWDSGQVTAAYQKSYRSNLAGYDRDFYRADLTSNGGTDFRTTRCDPGNIIVGGVNYPIPEGGATSANLVPGDPNRCEVERDGNDLMPEQDLDSFVMNFDLDLGDHFTIFADGIFAQREADRRNDTHTARLVVPETNAYFVAPAGVTLDPCPASAGVPDGTGCVSVDHSYAGAVGPAISHTLNSETWQIWAGFDWRMTDNWTLSFFASAAENEDQAIQPSGVVPPLQGAALRSSDPAAAYNPFGTANTTDPSVIENMFNFWFIVNGITEVNNYSLKVDGPLFQLPGGEVMIAAGLEYFEQDWKQAVAFGPRSAANNLTYRQFYNRDITSAFVEVFIPIVGEDNSVPGIHSLAVNLAGRRDDYNDVGNTTNPKFGVDWYATQDLKFHASYGESFRAPTPPQILSNGARMYYQRYATPTGDLEDGIAATGPNPDAQPETAKTKSFGFEYIPEALNGAVFSLNYFDVDYENQLVGVIANTNILINDPNSNQLYQGAEAQAKIQEQIDSGVPLPAGVTAEQALAMQVFVDARAINQAITEADGFDFSVMVPVATDSGEWRFGVQGVWFDSYKVAQSPTSPKEEKVNNIDYPLELELRGLVGWDSAHWNANAWINHLNSYKAADGATIDSYTTVDLAVTYSFNGDSGSLTENLRLGLRVNNLFDEDPPFVNIIPTLSGGGGYDAQLVSPLQQVVALTLTAGF